MKKLFAFTLMIGLIFMVCGTAVSADKGKPPDVKIKAIPVVENIYMLTSGSGFPEYKGGNIGAFIGKDGTLVVDASFPFVTNNILSSIKSLGGDTPKFLINTHFHGDHTTGNGNLGNKGTLIVSHDNVRERLANGSFLPPFRIKLPPSNKAALPVITYSDDMYLSINNESVHAIHVPSAHTDGDSIIHFKKANVVHTGDIFFNGYFPFIDVDNGGSVKGVILAVDTILSITDDNSKIIPGHGPLADKAQLVAYRNMLSTAYQRLLKLKNEGVTVEDAVIRKPLADLEAQWGGVTFSAERWIGIIYPGVN
ncbi:MAG: MBL fold metallo-hydrolase [Deltaproteobacteria bacterium]|jgi:cyclase|nr:MBL fold metallo-hydrolase [Deltaproteobacteria bacterium]